jgi:hypothetical protein
MFGVRGHLPESPDPTSVGVCNVSVEARKPPASYIDGDGYLDMQQTGPPPFGHVGSGPMQISMATRDEENGDGSGR